MPFMITTEALATSRGTPSAWRREALKGSPPRLAVGVSWFRASPPRRSQKRRPTVVLAGGSTRIYFQDQASSQLTTP